MGEDFGYTNDLKNLIDERILELQKAKQNLDKAQEIANIGHWDLDLKKNKLFWSDETYRIFGLKPKEFEASYENFLQRIHPDDMESVKKAYSDSLADKKPYRFAHRIVLPSGEIRYVEERCEHTLDENGEISHSIGTVHDITDIKRIQIALEDTNKKLKEYIKIVDENVITSQADTKGIVTYASEAFCRISGYTKEELIGKNHNIVRHPDMPKAVFEELWKTIKSGKTWEGEIKNRKKDGSCYWVYSVISPIIGSNGKIEKYTAVRQDITDKKLIEELSITDELTGLFNRRYFNKMIEKKLQSAKEEKKVFCFLIMDVDNFKKYNDFYGHQKGDFVLKGIGKTIKNINENDYTAFRLGGEEFGAIYIIKNENDADKIAQKIRQSIEDLQIEHKENNASPFVSASIGVAIADFSTANNNCDVDLVYKIADEALYRAKANGRNRVEKTKF
ncbi:MAG: hypothetical protein QG567_1164 [Campylobacterota bacterium]|nr:hypothetical protein [Campylobacterota bacterium]